MDGRGKGPHDICGSTHQLPSSQLTNISQADIGCAAVSAAEGNAKAESKESKRLGQIYKFELELKSNVTYILAAQGGMLS